MATEIEEEKHVVKLLLRPVVKCVTMTLLELLPCLLGVSMNHFEAVQGGSSIGNDLRTY
jgi:hypothetical protein